MLEFPNLSSFLSSKVPDLTKSYKINGCRVQLLSGSCVYTVLPQRAHCLTLGKTVSRLLPSYILALTAKEVKDLLPIRVSVFYINTCLAKVTFVTSAEGKLEFVPGGKLQSSTSFHIATSFIRIVQIWTFQPQSPFHQILCLFTRGQ